MNYKISKFITNLIYKCTQQPINILIAELSTTGSLSRDQLWKYKTTKMYEQIRYLNRYNKVYKDIFTNLDIDLQKKNIDTEFYKLPITNKEYYHVNVHASYDDKTKTDMRSTSGTTGTPFVFPKDRVAACYMDAMMYNAYSWHGIGIGDKQARLWGRAINTKEKLIQSVKDLVLNRKRLSAFEMNENDCLKYYDKLMRFKPKYFYTYSNALYQFAVSLEKNNRDGKLLGVSIAICTGEVLFTHQREKIAEVFGCRVVNEYGSTENGIIAFECEHGKMHVMPTIHLEIENPDENGMGQIVVTELNSRMLPFMRYKNGDIGKLLIDKCACKRPFDIIEIHEGRIDDYIRCPDGRLVYDAILAYTLKGYAIQFKAYQESLTRLRIQLIPNEGYDKKAETRLKKTLARYLGDEMEIYLLQVKEIPHEKSGKFRYFVSNL
ncbi:MAG: hypothetical protein PHO83_14980 [Geobacteraceae bacterium]|nr:hypothetical protein [Geobacteraceae bacterium]